jgi:putative transposase
MRTFRRVRQPGGHYFFTLVTRERVPWLLDPLARSRLREALRKVSVQRPFAIDALVLLPDHLHALWRLPPYDSDFSTRWRLVKHHVTIGLDRAVCAWQPRFWEHLIRNNEDWRRHVDYIHRNPVKHGLVSTPRDWPYSTFQRAVAKGWYSPDWGASESITSIVNAGE